MSDKVTELFYGEPRERIERNPMCAKMERCAGVMAQNFAGDLAGYIVIGVNAKGELSVGFGVDPNPDSAIGARMLAGLGIAAIQTEMITEEQIKNALIRNNLVQPPPGDAS